MSAPTWGPVGFSGFSYDGSTFTTLNDPISGSFTYTVATGINNVGQIVGYAFNGSSPSNNTDDSFIYDGLTYTTLHDPDARSSTEASGINDKGEVVGTYSDNSGFHGFVAETGSPTPEPATGGLLLSAIAVAFRAAKLKAVRSDNS